MDAFWDNFDSFLPSTNYTFSELFSRVVSDSLLGKNDAIFGHFPRHFESPRRLGTRKGDFVRIATPHKRFHVCLGSEGMKINVFFMKSE